MKYCEICQTQIPDDFQNLLCLECYKKIEERNSQLANQTSKTDATLFGITEPNYQENPEAEDKEQWETNLELFKRFQKLIFYHPRSMYNFIKDYCLKKVISHPQYPKFIWRPKIVDVGCGIGVGSNIMSQEADFVWGIDKNKNSILFAKEAFTRQKNGIYYSSQISFDVIDIMKDNREFMKFDLVVVIEVIEHIYDTHLFLKNIIDKFDKKNKDEPTEYFISTPNRNSPSLGKKRPNNIYHIREWTKKEFNDLLRKYFESVEFYSWRGVPDPDLNSVETPMLAKCCLYKL